jgi:hypothetical protein
VLRSGAGTRALRPPSGDRLLAENNNLVGDHDEVILSAVRILDDKAFHRF